MASERVEAALARVANNSKKSASAVAYTPSSDKVAKALQIYRAHAIGELQDATTRLQNEVGVYNSSAIIYGEDGFQQTAKSQSQSRNNLEDIRGDIERYAHLLDGEGSNDYYSLIDDILAGYGGQLKMAEAFKSEDEYKSALKINALENHFANATTDELRKYYDELGEGDVKDWLGDFIVRKTTPEEYDKLIAEQEAIIAGIDEKLAPQMEGKTGFESTAAKDDPERSGLFAERDAAEAELEKLKQNKWARTNHEKYDFLQDNADFEELSNGQAIYDNMTPKERASVDRRFFYINDINGGREARAKSGDLSAIMYGRMTEEQIAKYNYLFATQGEEAAGEYLDYLAYDLSAQEMADFQEGLKVDPDDSFLESVLVSAVSVPLNLVAGIGYIDATVQNIKNTYKENKTGEYAGPINYYSAAMAPAIGTMTARESVSSKIIDKHGAIDFDETDHPILAKLFNGKSWADVYQLGMSMVDSRTLGLISPSLGKFGTLLLGGSAATQTMLDIAINGGTDEQALTMGAYAGAFEFLFELFEIEHLLGQGGGFIKQAINQGFTEFFGEGFTTIANNIADAFIMAKDSDYMSLVAEYEADGMPTNRAKIKAIKDIGINVLWDAVGGFLSGGFSGSTQAGKQSILTNSILNKAAKNAFSGDLDTIVSEALEADPDNELAKKIQSKLDKNKNVSGSQIRKLVTSQDTSTIATATESRLTELGETENVKEIASAIAKQTVGKRLTSAERKLISDSKFGTQVADELDVDNLEKAAEWTESINTRFVNSAEYGLAETKAQLRKVIDSIDQQTAVEPQTARTVEAVSTGNDVADSAIQKAYSKELSGNDVRPILENPEALTALESVVGEIDLSNKTSSEKRQAVRTAIIDYVAANPIGHTTTSQAVPSSINSVAQKYGKQAEAVRRIYNISPMEDAESFGKAFNIAYNIGRDGGNVKLALETAGTQALSETQRRLAYATGESVRLAEHISGVQRGEGGGVVRTVGVSKNQLNSRFKKGSNQKTALQMLRALSAATGLRIEVFDSSGDYSKEQGSYNNETDVVRIDIAAGVCNATDVESFAKYAMLRTFTHEFTHVGEKWAPEEYNILRAAVIETLSNREDFDFERRVKQIQEIDYDAKKARYIADGMSEGDAATKAESEMLSWDMASREVVAEAMTDVLPESEFMRKLYEKSPSLAERLAVAFQKFFEKIKAYFDGLEDNPSPEARAMKVEIGGVVKYADDIIKMWDNMALKTVENLGKAKMADSAVKPKSTVQKQARDSRGNVVVDDEVTPQSVRKTLNDIFEGKYKKRSFTFPVLKHTPQVFMDYCYMDGDRSFVMQAYKAYKAMRGGGKSQHNLGVDGMMDVIYGLYYPDYIILQNGGDNDGHYVAVVTINDGEIVAAVDLGAYRPKEAAVNGEAGFYNVIITAFPNEDDYIDRVLLAENNDVLYSKDEGKKYEIPEYVAGADSATGRTPDISKKSIANRASKVNYSVRDTGAAVIETIAEISEEQVEQVDHDIEAVKPAVQYSIRPDAPAEIHKAVTDKNYGGDIRLTDTSPSIMLGHRGVKNLPMLMKASHIRENILSEEEAVKLGLSTSNGTNYHALGEELFKKVIDSLDDITVAYRGTSKADNPERRENCFLLLSTIKDAQGNTIIVPVYINESGAYNRVVIRANKIASVYGKNDLSTYIKREIAKGNLVRIKKRGPISSESPAPIAVDYADVTSAEEAADQAAMASYAPNISQEGVGSQEQNQLRTQSYSNREILELAYDNVSKMKLSEGERSALDIYKKRLDKLKDLEQHRDEQKDILSELNENPEANADEIKKTKSRISTYSKMVRDAESQVLSIEDKKVLKNVLKMASQAVETKERNAVITKALRSADRQNAKLREDLQDLKRVLKLQKSVTDGKKFTPKSVRTAADVLMKKLGVQGDRAELTPLLNEYYEAIHNDVDADALQEITTPIVEWLGEHGAIKDDSLADYELDAINQEIELELRDSAWNLSTLYTVADAKQKQIDALKEKHRDKVKEIRADNRAAMRRLKAEHAHEIAMLKKQGRTDLAEQREQLTKEFREKTQSATEERKQREAKTSLRSEIRKTASQLKKLLLRGTKERNVKEDMRETVQKTLELADILFSSNPSDEQIIRNGPLPDMSEAEAKLFGDAQSILSRIDEINRQLPTSRDITALAKSLGKENASPADIAERYPDIYDLNEELRGLDQKFADLMRGPEFKTILERARAKINNVELATVIQDIVKLYNELGKSEYSYIKNAYSQEAGEYLESLLNEVGSKKIRDMGLRELRAVNSAFGLVLKTVKNANKAFADGKDISEEAKFVVEEMRAHTKDRKTMSKLLNGLKKYGWNHLKPIYAFKVIGSETLTKYFNKVRAGEDTWATDVNDAHEFFLEQAAKSKYQTWDTVSQYEFTSEQGKKFSLNLGQMLSLYAYAKREAAQDHLQVGGIVFEGEITKKTKFGIKVKEQINDATAYRITPEIMSQIVDKIKQVQPEAIAFADAMQDYLSSVMGEKGNEVSLEMYGIKLFNEENYFPLKVASQYQERAREANNNERKIKNKGFTKPLTPNANAPIVLESFMDAWAKHVDEMAMYHGFVLPMEDFYRVYNYKALAGENTGDDAVNAVIQNAFGEVATDYIDQLLKDLNGGARSDPRATLFTSLLSKFKKAKTFLSLSTAIQQPSSIGRAFAYIDPKYFAGKKLGEKAHKAAWAEVKKYAPIAIIKEMGHFDTNTGRSTVEYLQQVEYESLADKAKGIVTDSKFRDEKLGFLPSWLDEVTWVAIWDAAKRQTAATTKHKVGSEEFFKAASELFTETIVNTQVYDSVLSRSANMRSKDTGMQMLTAFGAEPTTTLNMVIDGIIQAERGNAKFFGKTVAAVSTSIILNAALSSIIYAMRDDDEDETFIEKYLSSLLTEAVDGFNPFTYFVIAKDIWSALQGYDVERSDMTLITDLIDSAKRVISSFAGKDTADMDEEELEELNKEKADAAVGVLTSLFNLVGFPAENAYRELKAGINFLSTVSSGDRTTSKSLSDAAKSSLREYIPVLGLLPQKKKQDKLYDAILAGDEEYADRIMETYKTEDAAGKAIRKALRERDPRILEAAEAKYSGDNKTYLKILDEIVEEGFFSEENVSEAIIAEANAMAKEEDGDETEQSGYTTVSPKDYYKSAIKSDAASAKAVKTKYIAEAKAAGKSEKTALENLDSGFKEHAKEAYHNGEISKQKALSILKTYTTMEDEDVDALVREWSAKVVTGIEYGKIKEEYFAGKISAFRAAEMEVKYGGYSQEEADKRVAEWTFEKQHGYKPEDVGGLYKAGELSADKVKDFLINYKGMTEKKADEQIEVYNWEAEGYEGVTYPRIEDYNEYGKPAGVPPQIFFDIHMAEGAAKGEKDENGDTIKDSKVKEIIPIIAAANLTPAQKDAVALSLWSGKTVRKYKTW